jgi:tRNA-(ms[2]io[6]A)-hydroxylase
MWMNYSNSWKKDGSRNDAFVRTIIILCYDWSKKLWTIQSAIWKHQGYGISKFYRDLMISEAGHYTTFWALLENMLIT